MRPPAYLFFLAFSLLLVGCTGGGQPVKPKPEGLTYNLKVEGTKEVAFQLVVKNEGTKTKKIVFNSGQEFDYEVSKDGVQVWRWSYGRMFTQSVKETNLAPGVTLEPYVAVWAGVDNEGKAVAPGEYEVRGYFLGNGSKEPVAVSKFSLVN
ncbi:MAG: BsuPI-related putative proteinase inhibitor [Thermincolia bacterium]